MANWIMYNKKSDFDATAAKFGIRNITARLLTNRGVVSDEEVERYLNGDISMLRDPMELSDIEKGARIILDRIRDSAKIRVIGDYDVDGICSTFIFVKGLELFGADVDYCLPDRVKDGYGLSVKLVDEAFDEGRDTILTCDNGIAATEQIAHAKEKGMTVVVTDHHEVPFEESGRSETAGEAEGIREIKCTGETEENVETETAGEAEGVGESKTPDKADMRDFVKKEILPPADAVIDPKRRDGSVHFKEICGAVVVYKLLQVMAALSGREDENEVKSFFDEMIIFAGIATVCDVMELRDENRIIVKESLDRIGRTTNTGLKMLIDVNRLDTSNMSAYQYGFVIGPCLNASGRLDLAERAMELFLEEDESRAASLAYDLKDLNENRKTMTQQGVDSAVRMVEEMSAAKESEGEEAETSGSSPNPVNEGDSDTDEKKNIPKALVIYLPEVHESIAGIIAGRIKEKYYRPTIILTGASDGGVKGSGRSIEKYDMFTELSKCRDLFSKFGGHKMAAGLSLPSENVDELRRRLNEACTLEDGDFEPVLHLDMELPFYAADMDLVRDIKKLEPFGNGNVKPVFGLRGVKLLSGKILGKNKNCGKYRVSELPEYRLPKDASGKIPENSVLDSLSHLSDRTYDMMYFGDMDRWHSFLKRKFGKEAIERLYSGDGDRRAFSTFGNYGGALAHDSFTGLRGACGQDMVITIAYYPDINSFRGVDSLQFIMTDYQ